jgi:hypothetical protein
MRLTLTTMNFLVVVITIMVTDMEIGLWATLCTQATPKVFGICSDTQGGLASAGAEIHVVINELGVLRYTFVLSKYV